MKIVFLNLLAALTFLAVCLVGAFFLFIYQFPDSPLNPLPPSTEVVFNFTPTDTQTPQSLPATWTPVANEISFSLAPSSTPLPTATFFSCHPTPPSNTATLVATKTPEISATPQPDAARWISQSPADYTTLKRGQDFDMVWTVKNIGSKTWNSQYYLKFAHGDEIHSRDQVYFREPVEPGYNVTIILDMVAPKNPGVYRCYFDLINEYGDKFFSLYFLFSVR